MRIVFLIILNCLLSSYIFGSLQSANPASADDIVAEAGGIKITAEEFVKGYELSPAFIKRKADSKERYLNYLINEKLLALDGYEKGLDKVEQAKEYYDAFLGDLASEVLFEEDILSKVEINDADIDSVTGKKQLKLDIRWLYAENEGGVKDMYDDIISGISFDSLYEKQLSQVEFRDDRNLTISRFMLETRNPAMAKVIDSMKIGGVSRPVEGNDGWYIIKLENAWFDDLITEEEYNTIRAAAVTAARKGKMDRLSDIYVNKLLFEQQPVIKRDGLNILKSYLAAYELDREKYDEWQMQKELTASLENSKVSGSSETGHVVLTEYKTGTVTLNEFIIWYRSRDQFMKFNTADEASYTKSIENYIWMMLRDKLLVQKSKERGYDTLPDVVKEAGWWKDKIVYSMAKNEILSSAMLNNEKPADSDEAKMGASAALYRKVKALRDKYKVIIHKDILDAVNVQEEDQPKAIDFYVVKKGGLIPRTPYPTIDFDWKEWE